MSRGTYHLRSLRLSVGLGLWSASLLLLLWAGSGCAMGMGESVEEPPVVVGLSRSAVAVGESVVIIGGNFKRSPHGRADVLIEGQYTTTAGNVHPVNFEFRPHWQSGNELLWSPIGPYRVPFSPSGDELGVFDGTITVINVSSDGREDFSEPTPITLEMLPSLILTELQPVDAECTQPSKVILDTFNYRIGVRAIGFTPTNYTYVTYSPYAGLPRIMRHEANGVTDRFGLGGEFYFEPVPEDLPFYIGTMVAGSLGSDGIEYTLALNIGVHRPIEYIFHDEEKLAELLPATMDGGCSHGGTNLPITVDYEESQAETKARQLGINWNEQWLDSHSGTVTESRTLTNQVGLAVSQNVANGWEYEVERGRDISVGGQFGFDNLAKTSGLVKGEYTNIRREKGKLYGSVTDGVTVNQSYTETDTESWAFTRTQDYSWAVGGSDFWTATSTSSITRGFSGQLLPGYNGAFYRQVSRYSVLGSVVAYNRCGVPEVVADSNISNFKWGLGWATGPHCPPESPLPEAECFDCQQ